MLKTVERIGQNEESEGETDESESEDTPEISMGTQKSTRKIHPPFPEAPT